MVMIDIIHNLNPKQMSLIESWIDDRIRKYSDFSNIEVCVSGNTISLCYKKDSIRSRRLFNYLVTNIQSINYNKSEARKLRCSDPWITKFIDLEVPMPMSIQHKYNENQNIDEIRQQAKKVVQRKRDESMVALALSKYPYEPEFLWMYDKMKRGGDLTEYEKIRLELTIMLSPEPSINPTTARVQKMRINSVISAAENKTNDIMFIFQKQLERDIPLTEDQENVLRTWEEMYFMAQ